MAKKNNPLSSKDKGIMSAGGQENWIPPDPAELLLPYIEQAPKEELDTIEKKRAKAKEVYEGYGDVIEKCKELRANITQRCKKVVIPLTEQQHKGVLTALRRIFGFIDVSEITFDMYKIVVEEMQKLNNKTIPKPETQKNV